MTKEFRKIFEIELQSYLKHQFGPYPFIKVLRNRIKVTMGSVSGEIAFYFSNFSKGYMLQQFVLQPELRDFIQRINPPYTPRFKTSQEMIMNTYRENNFKCFSPTNLHGSVPLPKTEEEREKACAWIYAKVNEVYLPRVLHLMELKPEGIQDVLTFPDDYAYPFLTILYLIQKNKLPASELDIEGIISKKVLGSKSFDKPLLRQIGWDV